MTAKELNDSTIPEYDAPSDNALVPIFEPRTNITGKTALSNLRSMFSLFLDTASASASEIPLGSEPTAGVEISQSERAVRAEFSFGIPTAGIGEKIDAEIESAKSELTAHTDAEIDSAKTELTAHTDAEIDSAKSELTAHTDAEIDSAKSELTAHTDAEIDAGKTAFAESFAELAASAAESAERAESAAEEAARNREALNPEGKNDVQTVALDESALGDGDTFLELDSDGPNPTSFRRRPLESLWNYIKGKITGAIADCVADKLAANRILVSDADGNIAASGYPKDLLATLESLKAHSRLYYEFDLMGLPASNFYPVVFESTDFEIDCEIHSPNLGEVEPHNQNRVHFLLTSQGWFDTGYSFNVLSRYKFQSNEVTIGAIGTGARNGCNAVWLRGGLVYRFLTSGKPTLCTANKQIADELFTVGPNLWGGANHNVQIRWTGDY